MTLEDIVRRKIIFDKVVKITAIVLLMAIFALSIYLALMPYKHKIECEGGYKLSDSEFSPKDRINAKDIKIEDDKIIIGLGNLTVRNMMGEFLDSGSMIPVLSEGHNSIEIIPNTPYDIKVGDIISYKSSVVDSYIVHRVVTTGVDIDGWYATVKGDNLYCSDPEKVRFSQVDGVVVILIY